MMEMMTKIKTVMNKTEEKNLWIKIKKMEDQQTNRKKKVLKKTAKKLSNKV